MEELEKSVKRYYSSGEVMKLTDVTYRRLWSWVDREIIYPSGRGRNGKRRLLFTFGDVIEVQTLKKLTDSGVRLASLLRCVARLRRELGNRGDHALASTRLVTDGRNVFRYLPAEDKLENLNEFGQFAFAFGLGDEIVTLREKARLLDRRSRYVFRRPDINEANAEIASRTRGAKG